MKRHYAYLLYGAEKFGLEGLKIHCAKYLVKYLSVDIAVYCFILAYKYNMKYMLHRCARFINSNHKAIAENKMNLRMLEINELTALLEYYHDIPEKVLLFESSLVKREYKDREE
ncbi:hypothetical protein ACKWTF_013442 [Chironomus riparius]